MLKKEETDNIKSQMRKGILELCVLRLLSDREAYPSDIIKSLHEARLTVVEGTIYTLLNRLRREGKLEYEWRESRQGPPRKYFFLTPRVVKLSMSSTKPGLKSNKPSTISA